MLSFGSLFAGIGGFDLGFERAGMTCSWQVEIDPFCRKVLAKHWPHVRRHDDVRTFPPAPMEDWNVDVVCGGFPCQDISNAGKKAGIEGEQSGLWAEFARIVRQLRPRYVVVENVAALLVRGMGRVLGDLAACGFDAEWDVLPASAFGAPHERERLFLIAHSSEVTVKRSFILDGKHAIPRNKKWSATENIKSGRRWKRWLSEAVAAVDGEISSRDFCRVDDGLSAQLDRIGTTGNAVVPQVAEYIARRILEAEAKQ